MGRIDFDGIKFNFEPCLLTSHFDCKNFGLAFGLAWVRAMLGSDSILFIFGFELGLGLHGLGQHWARIRLSSFSSRAELKLNDSYPLCPGYF